MSYAPFEQFPIGRNIYGTRPVLTATSTLNDLWTSPAARWPLFTSAEDFEVVSDNANDTSAGTGIRTVRVNFIDASLNVQTEDITMNGTTAVAVPNGPYLRVRFVAALTVGTAFYGTAAGNIVVQSTTSNSGASFPIGTIAAEINPGDNNSTSCVWTVSNQDIPCGVVDWGVAISNVTGNNTATANLEVGVGIASSIIASFKLDRSLLLDNTSPSYSRSLVPNTLVAGTDVRIEVSGSNTAMSFNGVITLVKDNSVRQILGVP